MSTIKYKYEEYDAAVYRPVIPLILSFKDKSFSYSALIDSGADFCLFDTSVAASLGIELQDGVRSEAFGIGGPAQELYIHVINITVDKIRYQAKVGFIKNMTQTGYGILGQVGFFDKFKVSFDYANKEIILEPSKKRIRSLFWSSFRKRV